MKKFLCILLVALGLNVQGQINLEQNYQALGPSFNNLHLINLTSLGYKYMLSDTSFIKLYNLNHTIYKTISIPYCGPYSPGFAIYYVSNELFDTNPLNVEYVLFFYDSLNITTVRVYDDLGNILFTKDSAALEPTWGIPTIDPIIYTSSGVKMILRNTFSVPKKSAVYSLPGKLPCNECTNGVISGLANPNGGGGGNEMSISNSYPNPAINSTRIDYTFPPGVNQGEIVFYDLQGKEIKRYKVDKTFDHLLISTADIQAGTYFYQLQTSAAASAGKKMVVIK